MMAEKLNVVTGAMEQGELLCSVCDLWVQQDSGVETNSYFNVLKPLLGSKLVPQACSPGNYCCFF